MRWEDGKLRLDFEGSRVEVICKPGNAVPAAVRIDGRKPSEWPELYGFTRAVTTAGRQVAGEMACHRAHRLGAAAAGRGLDARGRARMPQNEKLFTFTLTGPCLIAWAVHAAGATEQQQPRL